MQYPYADEINVVPTEYVPELEISAYVAEVIAYGYTADSVLAGAMQSMLENIANELIIMFIGILPIAFPVIGIMIAIRIGMAIFTLLLTGQSVIDSEVAEDCDDYIREARRNAQLERHGLLNDDNGSTETFWNDSSDWDTSDMGGEMLFARHSNLNPSSFWSMSDDLDP